MFPARDLWRVFPAERISRQASEVRCETGEPVLKLQLSKGDIRSLTQGLISNKHSFEGERRRAVAPRRCCRS